MFFQGEYDALKISHERSVQEAQQELKRKLDALSHDLDARWADTLRAECNKLRHEVTQQKDEDRRAALEQLTAMKDEELAAAKQGWQDKINELLKQVFD